MAIEQIQPNPDQQPAVNANTLFRGSLPVRPSVLADRIFFDDDAPKPPKLSLVEPIEVVESIHNEVATEAQLPGAVDRRFRDKLFDSFLTGGAEIYEKGHRAKRMGAFFLGLETQGIDRGRALMWFLPTVFESMTTRGFENGWEKHQIVAAAVGGVAASVAAYTSLIGKSFDIAIRAFPQTTEAVEVNHPAMVGSVSRAVNGFPTLEELQEKQPIKPEAGYDVNPYQTHKTVAGKVGLGALRGLKTAFLFGSTPHVGMAEVRDHSKGSVNKRLAAVSAESAAVFGTIAAGLGILIVNSSAETAENIKNVMTNKWILGGLTAGSIVWGIWGNRADRHKHDVVAEDKVEEQQEITDVPTVLAQA